MAAKIERFTVSISPSLLGSFDAVCAAKGYSSRSEAIRDAIRAYLVQQQWESGAAGDVVGTITLVYEHGNQQIVNQLLAQKAAAHELLVACLHVHIDADSCLEVIIARGQSAAITQFANRLISLRGVSHGRLTAASAPTAP